MTERLRIAVASASGLIALALAIGSYAFTTRPLPVLAPLAAPPWRPELGPVDQDGRIQEERREYPEIVARPLFSPTRLPPQPIAAEPEQEPPSPKRAEQPPPASLALIGVLITRTAQKALIQAGDSSKTQWVAQGGEIAGWHVARIARQSVWLKTGDQILEMKLYRDDPPK